MATLLEHIDRAQHLVAIVVADADLIAQARLERIGEAMRPDLDGTDR